MKKLLKVLPILLVICFTLTSVFALDIPDSASSMAGDQTGIGEVNTASQKVWATVMNILQILAIAAVVFAGVRYMFASADQKADIKKSMIVLVIGAVLVFAATGILKFIQSAANSIVTAQQSSTGVEYYEEV